MTDPDLVNLFSQPQMGGDLPYFRGKQYGTGFVKDIGRVGYPLLIKAGKALGRIAVNTVDDVLANKGFGESLKSNAANEFNAVKDSLMNVLGKKRKKQTGGGGSSMNKRRKRAKTSHTIFDR